MKSADFDVRWCEECSNDTAHRLQNGDWLCCHCEITSVTRWK